MKPLASYFGNRFAAVPAKKSKTARKAASEMEALESRLLLSGIVADGSKSYKKLTYTDLEGDKVTISVTKGSFTVLGTNGDSRNELFTVDKITLDSLASTSTLSIKVANIKANGNGDAFTEIGEITSAKNAMKSITLDGANVANINLGDTSLSGGIVLKATAANIIDRNNPAGTMGAISNVNFNNISVQSVATIQAATQAYGLGVDGGLNFNGAITVDDGTTAIIGRTSQVNGALNLAAVENLNVGAFGAGSEVTTSGDLILVVSDGGTLGSATFNVAKNLHLGVLSGGLEGAVFNVTGSISGANSASTTDVVSINGKIITGTEFNTDSTFAGISVSGGDADFTIGKVKASSVASIGDITVSQGSLTSVLAASGNIGNISVRDELDGSVTSTAGSIGTISADHVTGAINADTTIGAITLDGAGATGNIEAGTSIASISAVGAVGAIEAGTSIGNISAAYVAGTIEAGTTIGNITAGFISTVVNAAPDVAQNVTAGTSVGSIILTSANDVGAAVANITAGTAATVTAAQTGGSIGNVTAAGDVGAILAYNGGVGNIEITGGSLTSVTAGSINNAGGFGFAGSGGNIGTISITAATAAVALETLGNVNAYNGNIGAITLTNASLPGTINSGSAKVGTLALIGGNIGDITVTNTLGAAVTGAGTSVTSLNGTIGNIALSNSAANSEAVNGTLTIDSVSTLGNVSIIATGAKSDGIGAGLTTITGTTIGNVTVTGTGDSTTDGIAVNGILTIGDNTANTGTSAIGNLTINGLIGGAASVDLVGRAIGTSTFGATVGNITVNSAEVAVSSDIITIGATNIISLGNILHTGDSNDTLDINVAATTVEFLTSVGTITTAGNLDLDLDDNKLVSLGNVDISGILTIGATDLKALVTAGTFDVGQISAGAAASIGNSNTGLSIGLITIGDSNNPGVGSVTFSFETMNGVALTALPSSVVVALLTPAGGAGTVNQVTASEANAGGAPATQDDIVVRLI